MSKPSKKAISLFVLATVIFFAANGVASALFAKYKEGVKEDFAAESIKNSDKRPNVVFAGSSTVLYPMYQLDWNTYGPQPGLEQYTRIHFVEDALLKTSGRKVQVNNVSFLGFMISDDLFVIKNYLTGKHAPDTLVMMVAPRDFCDSLFESPASGIAFRKLSDWSNTLEFCGTYLTQPNDYVDFALGKTVFTYAMRAKIQDKLHDYFSSKQESQKQIQPLGADATPDQKWAKSIREYTTRYRNISFDKMQKQFVFLNRLLAVCNERHIHVVLVNAPLTQRSLEMLPDGLYDKYNQKLAETAKNYSCNFVDFSQSNKFTEHDFFDIVHLNNFGAQKVLSEIMPDIKRAVVDASNTSTATVSTASAPSVIR